MPEKKEEEGVWRNMLEHRVNEDAREISRVCKEIMKRYSINTVFLDRRLSDIRRRKMEVLKEFHQLADISDPPPVK